MRNPCVLLFVFFVSFSSVLPLSEAGVVKLPDKIRVVVADNVPRLTLSIRGGYKLKTIETDQVLKEGRTFFNINIIPTKYGIKFGNDYLKIYGVDIIPGREPAIYLGKRLYRGSLQIIKTKEGLLRAINVVKLEDYLKGVLYHEVSHRWPMEAIKSQAVASRTFALYQAEQNKNNYYYLKADTSSQVYGGVYAERYRTNKAVEETKGKVLLYKDEILPAFFHATCGGKTEDSSRLWKVKMTPLKGVRCAFCRNSPHFSWERSIRLKEIKEKLNGAGYKLSDIVSIDVKMRDKSGRVIQLSVKAKAGNISISAKDFRHIIGPTLLKSTNFAVDVKGTSAIFKGRGWGHGVGMCQWGAFAMAKKRMKVNQILKHYYPGARVVTLESKKE